MTTSIIKNEETRKIARKILAAALWLALWQLLCLAVKQEILIVSPVCVLKRLTLLVRNADFWLTVVYSMGRIVLGFLIGVAAGSVLAVITSASAVLYDIFHPIVSIIKATPVASFIILALVWIRAENVPTFTASLIVLPIVWENVSGGIHKTDVDLLEMARMFCFGRVKTLFKVYLPSVMPYLTAACASGLGFAWKAGVAAEVLSSLPFSIGGRIYDAKIYLDTADLFAWTAVVILMSVLLEIILNRAVKRIWKKYGGGYYKN